jgi:hypothetical protein
MIKSELLAQLDTAIADCWPGPLTVILPTKHNGAIAYRVPLIHFSWKYSLLWATDVFYQREQFGKLH